MLRTVYRGCARRWSAQAQGKVPANLSSESGFQRVAECNPVLDSMRFMTFLAVAAGGAFGAVARYGVSLFILQNFGGGFPWGTLAVNLIGCFLFGLIDGYAVSIPFFSAQTRLLAEVGFLGAFTTFSTFSMETLRVLHSGQWLAAGSYAALSLIGGIALVALGIGVGAKIAVGG